MILRLKFHAERNIIRTAFQLSNMLYLINKLYRKLVEEQQKFFEKEILFIFSIFSCFRWKFKYKLSDVWAIWTFINYYPWIFIDNVTTYKSCFLWYVSFIFLQILYLNMLCHFVNIASLNVSLCYVVFDLVMKYI